jgi:hypothetical protein
MSQPTDGAETKGTGAKQAADEFAREADTAPPGIVREFGDFLLNNKKWWLTPIILVLLLFGLLIVLSGSGAAPFIYTLF